MHRVAVVITALLLAGCTTADPKDPERSGGVWSGVWDGPYAALTYGYGFVAVDEEGYGPVVGAVAVDHAGHVLVMEVRYRASGDSHRIELDEASAPWRGPIEETFAQEVLGNEHHQYQVTNATGRTLDPDDWSAVRHALRDGIATARDPRQHEGSFVADGGSRIVFAAGGSVTLDDNHDDGDGWGDIEEQMELLLQWIVDEGGWNGNDV